MAVLTARRGAVAACRRRSSSGESGMWTQLVNLGSWSAIGSVVTLTSATGAYAGGPGLIRSGMTSVADFEVTFDITVPDLGEQYPVISVRADTNNSNDTYPLNGLGFEFQPAAGQPTTSHWIARQVVAGTKTELGSGDYGLVANTATHVKIRCEGTLWQVRLWNGGTEPATWNLSATTTVTAAGKMFAGSMNGSAGTAKVYTVSNIMVSALTFAMPTTEPADFTRVWAEDFTTAAALGSFIPDGSGRLPIAHPYRDSIKCYPDNAGYPGDLSNGRYYSSKVFSAITGVAGANGVLDEYLHFETVDAASRFLSGWFIPYYPSHGEYYTYGRFSIRMRADQTARAGGVHLLIPDTWPQDGEYDWPEGQFTESPVGGFEHYADPAANSGNFGSYQQHVDGIAGSVWSDWHVYTQEWTPGHMKWYMDGVLCLDSTDRVSSAAQKYVPFQCGINGGLVPTAGTECHVQIDWATSADYTP
jgi:hypothetical protein